MSGAEPQSSRCLRGSLVVTRLAFVSSRGPQCGKLTHAIDVRLAQGLCVERECVSNGKNDNRKQPNSVNHDCCARGQTEPQCALNTLVGRKTESETETRRQHNKHEREWKLELANARAPPRSSECHDSAQCRWNSHSE